jgi:hypothetical protein
LLHSSQLIRLQVLLHWLAEPLATNSRHTVLLCCCCAIAINTEVHWMQKAM